MCCLFASRVLEMRCRRVDARDLEFRRRAAGVGTCRSLPQELWRCAAGVGTSRYGDRELWRRAVRVATDVEEFVSRTLGMRCGRVDVEKLEISRHAAGV